jgi:hypothetical protein
VRSLIGSALELVAFGGLSYAVWTIYHPAGFIIASLAVLLVAQSIGGKR